MAVDVVVTEADVAVAAAAFNTTVFNLIFYIAWVGLLFSFPL